jgi:putative NADH-flavin reductase
MRIAVVGASGWLGGALAEQALERGHEVIAIARHASRMKALSGAETVAADVLDPDAIADAIRGSDVVVSAITDRSTADRSSIPAAIRSLLEAMPRAGVNRLAVVGGGGSLEARPGVRFLDEPGFPDEYRQEAEAQAEALAILRADATGVDWTYLSPPPHRLLPGERTGTYRVRGGDSALFDESGESSIASGDFASALLDEIESPRFPRTRFTVAY